MYVTVGAATREIRGRFCKVTNTDLGDGYKGEVQVHTPESWKIKKESDEIYKKWRDKKENNYSDNDWRQYQNDIQISTKLSDDYWGNLPADLRDKISSFDNRGDVITLPLDKSPSSSQDKPPSNERKPLPSADHNTSEPSSSLKTSGNDSFEFPIDNNLDSNKDNNKSDESQEGRIKDILNDNNVNEYINKSVEEGTLKINEYQKKNIIEKIKEFPIFKSIKSKLGETVIFEPREGQNPLNYVLHFLTKYSKDYNSNIYNDKYAEKVNKIEDTIKDYDERILGEANGEDRIYYIRKINDGKEPYHIVVTTDPKSGEIRGWTHFDTKEQYIVKLKDKEKQLINNRGTITKDGEAITKDYEEYLRNKRITPLYLGERGFRRLQSTQITPTLHNKDSENTGKSQEGNNNSISKDNGSGYNNGSDKDTAGTSGDTGGPDKDTKQSNVFGKFWEKDIKPQSHDTIRNVKDMCKGLINMLAPTAGVNKKVLDIASEMKGMREYETAKMSAALDEIHKGFETLPLSIKIYYIAGTSTVLILYFCLYFYCSKKSRFIVFYPKE